MSNVLRSLLGAIRGGVHPREIGLAVFLGVLAGFVSGVNLTLAVVLLAVLVLRAPPKMFAQAWAVAAGLAWTLTPVTFRLGHYLLSGTRVGDWLAPHADAAWVAMFDLDRYTLIGGACLASVLALPTAWGIAAATRGVQQRLVALQEKMAANQRWQARWSTRLTCWLLFGETKLATAGPSEVGWFRRAGVRAAVLLVLPATVLGWLYLPKLLERGILDGISLANQAEVSAERFDLRLSQGTLEIEGLAIADPRNLDRDRLRIDQLTAELRPGPLLHGQLHVGKIALTGVATDVARSQRARRYELDLSGFGGEDKPEPRDHSPGGDSFDFGLPDYAKDWKQIDGRLIQVQDLLEKIEYLATKYRALASCSNRLSWQQQRDPSVKPDDASLLTPAYAQLRAMRHNFGPPSPAVWIEELRATNFAPSWGLGTDATVQLTDLSSEPELTRRPVKLLFEADRGDLRLEAAFNVHRPGAPHDVSFEARDVALERLVDTSKLSHAFAIQAGKLGFSGQGTMTSRQVDLPLKVAVTDLNVRLVGEQKVAGLTPDLWNQGLSKLGGLSVESRLAGRWQSPRLRVNTKDLADQFQAQLRAAGHAVLAQAVDAQMARAQQAVTKAVDQAAHKAQDTIAQQRAKADAAVGAAQQQVTKTTEAVQKQGTAAEDWLQERRELSKLGGGLPGGNPLAQAAESAINAAAGQSRQQVEPGHASSAHLVDQGAGTARSPLTQMLEASAAAGQAAPQGAGSPLPGDGTGAAVPKVVTNAPAAIGPYAEMGPGPSAYPNPFARPSSGAAGQAPGSGGVATAEDSPVPGGAAGGSYPSTGYPSTGYPSTGYPSTGYPSTGYPSTGYPSVPPPGVIPSTPPSASLTPGLPPQPGYPNYPGAATPATQPQSPEKPFARPSGAAPLGNASVSGPQSQYRVPPPQYPTSPQQYSTSPPQNPFTPPPQYPTAPSGYPPPTGPYPVTPPPSGSMPDGLPTGGSNDPRVRSGNAGYPPMGVNGQPPGGAQRGYASDFYSDEPESPAYEAGGKYELAQPPQGAGIGRRRGLASPPGEAASSDFPSPPLPQGGAGFQPAGQAGSPSQGELGPPQTDGPGGGYSPNGGPINSADQTSQPQRRLPVALRGREAAEEAATRPGPPPVALRGRPQPTAPAGGVPGNDEWRITRWTRDAGSSVKGFFFGSSGPPPQNSPPPQNTAPVQNPHPPTGQQPQSYAGASSYVPSQQNMDPRGANGPAGGQRTAISPMDRQPATANLPSPASQQASQPWYKFW